MPELPEVETVRRDLNRYIRRLRITRVEVFQPKCVQPRISALSGALVGAQSIVLQRRAKYLVWRLSTCSVVIHLKMTGQLVWKSGATGKLVMGGHPIVGARGIPNKHTCLAITFANGSVLYYNDVRRFGYLRLSSEGDITSLYSRLGLEPLRKSFTETLLQNALLRRKRSNIKSALLDQTVVAGIGNIYADEILFAAGIKPTSIVGKLNEQKIKALYAAIKKILTTAIRTRGTSFTSYSERSSRKGTYWERRLAYGRFGEPCRKCGRTLVRAVVAQRGTTYCNTCQE